MESFSMDNVLSGGAIGISVTGMSIVFSGLLLISIYIRFLPGILDFLDRYILKKELLREEVVLKSAGLNPEMEEKDLASVIGLVMQLEAVHHETPMQKEEKDIAHIIGMVLQMEQEQQFGLPN